MNGSTSPMAARLLERAVRAAHPGFSEAHRNAIVAELFSLGAYAVTGDGELIPGDSPAALAAARRLAPRVADHVAREIAAKQIGPADRTAAHLHALGISTDVIFDEDDDGDFPLEVA